MTMNGVTMTYKASTTKPVGPDINGKMQSVKDAIDKGISNGVDALKRKQAESESKTE